MNASSYPRDLVGCGRNPPHPHWPGEAGISIAFILAVKGLTKADILASFEERLKSTPEQEFATALAEVEKIALIRLRELLPG